MNTIGKLKVDAKKAVKKSVDTVMTLTPYTRNFLKFRTHFAPPGHYYSPIPDVEEIKRNEEAIAKKKRQLPAVDLNEEGQMELLEKLKNYYGEMPFTTEPSEKYRYHFGNSMYAYSDATFLFCMIRHFKPKRIIEVGSGFSSAVILDTNEHFHNNEIECTFIEPFPEERLLGLVRDKDEKNLKVNIVKDFVQNVPVDEFRKLEAGDIFFIDSSHVAKCGSDVCHLIFEVLPLLKKGVVIHIHDVFTSFEYPVGWLKRGFAWNEAYFLRAFLQYNDTFKIIAFNSFLEDFHEDWFRENMPICLELHEKFEDEYGEPYWLPNRGQSIWLQKVK